MRISDWSSDVCSSDLAAGKAELERVGEIAFERRIGGPVAARELARLDGTEAREAVRADRQFDAVSGIGIDDRRERTNLPRCDVAGRDLICLAPILETAGKRQRIGGADRDGVSEIEIEREFEIGRAHV